MKAALKITKIVVSWVGFIFGGLALLWIIPDIFNRWIYSSIENPLMVSIIIFTAMFLSFIAGVFFMLAIHDENER